MGKLSVESASIGMQAAINNAAGLLSDAELLFTHKRYERAAALAVLAIEEAGKPPIIRMLLLEDDPKIINREWKNYRNHLKKNATYLLPKLASEGARQLEDYRQLFDETSDHPILLEKIKQSAFYTDAVGAAIWSEPKQSISFNLAKSILDIARLHVHAENHPMTSIPELELWMKHMKPVWRKDMLQMKQALTNCYREAEDTGVLQGNQKTPDVVKFLF